VTKFTSEHKSAIANAILLDVSLSPATRLVGWFIADNVHSRRGYAWPPQEHTASRLGIAIRTVRRAARDLAAARYFTVNESGRAHEYHPCGYFERPARALTYHPAKADNLAGVDTGQKRPGYRTKTTVIADKKVPPSLSNPINNLPGAAISTENPEQRDWHSVKNRLAISTSPDIVSSWFENLKLRSVTELEVVLIAPTRFASHWITQHFDGKLADAWHAERPSVIAVRVIDPDPP
jgi:hypothetical protein